MATEDVDDEMAILAMRAKAIVAHAFRNGPFEDLHAKYDILQDEVKSTMKEAVNRVYALLLMEWAEPEAFDDSVEFLCRTYARQWDDPDPVSDETEALAKLSRARLPRLGPLEAE